MKKLLCIAVGLLLASNIQAAAIPQLKAFIDSTSTLSADFTQVVSSKNKRSEAKGNLSIARPGRFLWVYSSPYDQKIDGDGKHLWIYDKELAQITTRPLNAALGSSPAALLAGNNAIGRDYQLKEAGSKNGMDWLSATPRKSENTFTSIRMGFRDNALQQMILTDSFGNTTQFKFTPPKGVDVISDQ